MTTPTPPAPEPVCCGEGGTWAPAGKPLVVGCQLCKNSPTYWRNAKTTEPKEPAR
jgi:hypothetical protein